MISRPESFRTKRRVTIEYSFFLCISYFYAIFRDLTSSVADTHTVASTALPSLPRLFRLFTVSVFANTGAVVITIQANERGWGNVGNWILLKFKLEHCDDILSFKCEFASLWMERFCPVDEVTIRLLWPVSILVSAAWRRWDNNAEACRSYATESTNKLQSTAFVDVAQVGY
jgi:hypothetical protein